MPKHRMHANTLNIVMLLTIPTYNFPTKVDEENDAILIEMIL